MSRVRPWTNGDQVALEGGLVPVKTYLYDSAGNPLVFESGKVPSKSYLHDDAGTGWTQDANGGMPVNLVGVAAESNGGLPVNIQDQTTPTILIPANQVVATSTLAATATLDTNSVSVTDASAMSVGEMYVVTSTTGDRYAWGYITAIAGAGPYTVTLSNYLDYAFESGQEFSSCIDNMAVDGSASRQIFSLRAAEPAGGINLTVDVTRIIIQCLTSTAPVLTDFGDIAGGITNGLQCRRIDGTYQNIFSVRSNEEIQSLAYDMQLYSALGVTDNGLSARLTFAGQEKIGVVLRIGTGEDLQFIVHDDLSSLTELRVMIQGHVVTGVGS